MESGLSASDVAMLNRDGDWGGNSFMWIFALLILAGGGFGNWNNGRYMDSPLNTYATAASQQEILFGQQFQGLDNKIDRIGNGIADATFALNNSIKDGNYNVASAVITEGRGLQTQLANCCCENQKNVDSVRFDLANYACAIQSNDTANTQKILDAIAQNKIESLQGQINQLQLQNALCGVVRYPQTTAYMASPCNCGCGNI